MRLRIVYLSTGYLEQGMMVRDLGKLRQNYLESRKWIWDVISMFPSDIVYVWWPPGSCVKVVPCPVIVRWNRLFRYHSCSSLLILNRVNHTPSTNYPHRSVSPCPVQQKTNTLAYGNSCLSLCFQTARFPYYCL